MALMDRIISESVRVQAHDEGFIVFHHKFRGMLEVPVKLHGSTSTSYRRNFGIVSRFLITRRMCIGRVVCGSSLLQSQGLSLKGCSGKTHVAWFYISDLLVHLSIPLAPACHKVMNRMSSGWKSYITSESMHAKVLMFVMIFLASAIFSHLGMKMVRYVDNRHRPEKYEEMKLTSSERLIMAAVC